MEKKRYEIEVAGVELAIISDEREEFVNTVVEIINKEIKDITTAMKRSSNLDASILLAIQYYSEKVKAEKRARNLEAQIALYDANLRRFREENLALKSRLEALESKEDNGVSFAEKESEVLCENIAQEASEGSEAEVTAQEEGEQTSCSEDADAAQDGRAAKLRAIEELLGRGGKKN